MRDILGDDACRVQEGKLRFDKRDTMLSLVLRILGRIPLEAWVHLRKYIRGMGPAPYAYMGADAGAG